MPEAEVAECAWREPGGKSAAQTICAFLARIGIAVAVAAPDARRFVPGMAVENGTILIDPAGAAFPGDLLHEAGHLAVTESGRRGAMSEVGADPAEELAAIAWSVAAARACGVPLEVLFHPAGYKGGSDNLIADWEAGQPFGVPVLAWYGLTSEAEFPTMRRWLR